MGDLFLIFFKGSLFIDPVLIHLAFYLDLFLLELCLGASLDLILPPLVFIFQFLLLLVHLALFALILLSNLLLEVSLFLLNLLVELLPKDPHLLPKATLHLLLLISDHVLLVPLCIVLGIFQLIVMETALCSLTFTAPLQLSLHLLASFVTCSLKLDFVLLSHFLDAVLQILLKLDLLVINLVAK